MNETNAPATTLVTVFGGSGFVGRHVVRALARQGFRVRVAVRRPHLAHHLLPMGTVGQIHVVQANVRDFKSVNSVMAGSHAVVNLVGILKPSGKQTFDKVHLDGARHIAMAAAAQGITNMVHVSAIGADANSSTAYGASKGKAESAVFEHMRQAVVLRPSVIFGPEDEFFNKFANMARFLWFLPEIGWGRTQFQPVFVGDVAKAVVSALEGVAKPGTIYELGGPKKYSFTEILKMTLEITRRKCILAPIPFPVAKLIGSVMQVFPYAPITADNVEMMKIDNVVSEAATKSRRNLKALGIQGTPTEAVIPQYLARYRKFGEFSVVE